ncbi:hypothetical protein V4F39_07865 [Aquincola sp. MAHUQ-54]|uniref:Uncharacterized protein n=1 Tax=Aquincola agrisoli TaxID=3119538 RepID=A0AAW9QBU4_9BURK
MNQFATFSLAGLLSVAAVAAQAQAPATHPALQRGAAAVAGGIDPSTFRVGHPASPRWQVASANGQHPAVLVARQAPRIDSNTFLVQPPASVTWTPVSEGGTAVAPTVAAAR